MLNKFQWKITQTLTKHPKLIPKSDILTQPFGEYMETMIVEKRFEVLKMYVCLKCIFLNAVSNISEVTFTPIALQ